MISFHSSLPAIVGALALGLTACDGPIARPSSSSQGKNVSSKLVLNKDARAAIVLSSDATPAERYAAEELSLALGKIFQRSFEVESTDTLVPDAVNFVIGRHPANAFLAPDQMKEEESVIKISGKTVHLVGGQSASFQTDASGNKIPLHDRGTLYAVYDFLESLGVRWYRPEPWGEHIPEHSEITLEDGESRTSPVYRYRYGIAHYNTYGVTDEWLQKHQTAKIWAIRNRQNANLWNERNLPGVKREQYGGNHRLDFSHAYWRYISPDKYFKTNPEYFALINGVRSSDRYAQLCLGNVEVQELIYQRLKKIAKENPGQSIFSLDPNDFMLWCECPLCVAMDEPKTKASFGNGAGGVSMSNRVARFNNLMAARLAKDVPGAGVGYYAYAQHTDVPAEEISFEPNIYIQAAPFGGTFSDFSRRLDDPKSSPNRRFKAVLDGYKGRVNLMAREYWSFYAWPGPLPIVHTLTDRLRAYHRDYGMNGVYSETHPCWGPQGMSIYFYTWLLRNPYGDVEKEKDLYYQNFYGPAYAPMKAYHDFLEEVGQGGTFYNSGGSEADKLITQENAPQLRQWITEAQRLTGDREPYARRLATVAAGQDYSELALQFRTLKAANRIMEAQEKLDEMEAYLRKYPDGSVFDVAPGGPSREDGMIPSALRSYRAEMKGASQMLALFENPVVALDLTKMWRFRPVTEEAPQPLDWAAPAHVESNWARLDAGKAWQRQGYESHHGMGLYRKSFTAPVRPEAGRTVLYFEQIDGHAEIYLDGQKVGERRLGPKYEGYDKAWYVDLTDQLIPGKKHQIAVEVVKSQYAGGLTKPVFLLNVETIRPPDQ